MQWTINSSSCKHLVAPSKRYQQACSDREQAEAASKWWKLASGKSKDAVAAIN